MKYRLYAICMLFPLVMTAQNQYDVVIDEVMADPTPSAGLPGNEWIELKNVSALPVNLQNWRIADASGQSGPMPNFILQPDSFVIVCTGSAIAAMSVFGKTIAVTSFPSLDNEGELLYIKSSNGKTIHAIAYNSDWYQNELKQEGGWTLEMIDTKNPCTGFANWIASYNGTGGTPGKKNSVDAVNRDEISPRLQYTYTLNDKTVILVFDEPLDSLSATSLSNYSFDAHVQPAAVLPMGPLFNQVEIKLLSPLLPGKVYHITVSQVRDCKGNSIGTNSTKKVGLPIDASPRDLIINEILFNPRSGAFDFIELYNRSNKIFDLSTCFTANRNSSGTISAVQACSLLPIYIFPDEYYVVTVDPKNLGLQYLLKDPDHILAITSFPSLPDDAGTVITLNFQGVVVDEVNYKDDWHFKMIDNPEGVSLERIDPEGGSEAEQNWHSAASTSGYATPGYKNSQYKLLEKFDAKMEVHPEIFSPDNDGRDDIATLQIEVGSPGYIANIIIFDIAGRLVRTLVRNGTLGLKNYWNWDGLNDQGSKPAVGNYIIVAELFNQQGVKEKFMIPVVLARKLN